MNEPDYFLNLNNISLVTVCLALTCDPPINRISHVSH